MPEKSHSLLSKPYFCTWTDCIITLTAVNFVQQHMEKLYMSKNLIRFKGCIVVFFYTLILNILGYRQSYWLNHKTFFLRLLRIGLKTKLKWLKIKLIRSKALLIKSNLWKGFKYLLFSWIKNNFQTLACSFQQITQYLTFWIRLASLKNALCTQTILHSIPI